MRQKNKMCTSVSEEKLGRNRRTDRHTDKWKIGEIEDIGNFSGLSLRGSNVL